MCSTFVESDRCSDSWVCFRSSSILSIRPKYVQFFSRSNNRWKIVIKYLGGNKVLKNLSKTRFARTDAIYALHNGYNHIFKALFSIASNTDQSEETRNKAQ